MSEARGLFDYQREASKAKSGRRIPSHLRLAEEPVSDPVEEAGPAWTRQAARLDSLGWEHKLRMGRRIWSHVAINGGHWYGEEMAMQLNDERKG